MAKNTNKIMLYPWKIIPGEGVSFELLEDNKTIKVSAEAAAEVVATPVLTRDEHGVFTATCETEGALICLASAESYSSPIFAQGIYRKPVQIDLPYGAIVKAWAIKGGMLQSEIVTVQNHTLIQPSITVNEADNGVSVSISNPNVIHDYDHDTYIPVGVIYYTLDGTDPVPSNPNRILYNGPFLLDEPAEIRALVASSFAADADVSAVTVKDVQKIILSEDPGAQQYANNIQELNITSIPDDADIRYTDDGTDPSSSSSPTAATNPFRFPIYNENPRTFKFRAYRNSPTVCIPSDMVTVSEQALPAPVITDEGGMVTISEDVPDEPDLTTRINIYYTTDGSDPDEKSTQYTAPFSVPGGTTVKAVAIYTYNAVGGGIDQVESAVSEHTTEY